MSALSPASAHRLPSWLCVPLLLALAGSAAAIAGPAASPGDDPRDRPYPHGDWQEDCNLCHRDEAWLPIRPTKDFNHGKYFPLEGAHRTAACRGCHKSLEFDKNRGRQACVNCHQDVHRGEFGLDCSRCHTPRSFIDRAEMVRGHRTYRFPLTGAHVAADCEACHRPQPQGAMTYLGVSTECVSCHLSDYNGATDPNHRAAGFPTDCSLCHVPVSFVGATFRHSATRFPLTGAHRQLPCSDCHADGVYAGKSTLCYSCHRTMYEAQRDPNHVVAGFDQDCTLCHNTTSFAGARFAQHDSLYFPIYAGTHALGRWNLCSDCHTASSSSYAPFSCFACHSRSETDSQHAGNGDYFYDSQACYSCHPRGTV
jgi:hypothetical protein